MAVGVWHYDRANLERMRTNGEMLDLKMVGMVIIADDVTPELACDTIQALKVNGVLRASRAVKAALAGRIA
jgi:hypothetical protein